jgi:hypothetical protein
MHLVGMAREGWASGTLSRLGYLLNCFDESSIVCLNGSRDVSHKYNPNPKGLAICNSNPAADHH